MSEINFPPRRIDGVLISSATGSTIKNPSFNSVDVTGPNMSLAGQNYQWPALDGDPSNVLVNSGSNLLEWKNNTGTSVLTLLQDVDGNTRLETEQTPNDNVVRLISNNVEVQNITATDTIISNDIEFEEPASLTLKSTPLNYTVATAPIHIVNNNYTYYCSGTDLIIIDSSKPETVSIISTTTIGFISPTSMKIQGDYLYVTETSNIYDSYIINISDKTAPVLIGTLPYNGIEDISIQGNNMYIVPDFVSPPIFNYHTQTTLDIAGSSVTALSTSIGTDSDNNIYFGGSIVESVTFGPFTLTQNPAEFNATYVTKQDANGIFLWLNQIVTNNLIIRITSTTDVKSGILWVSGFIFDNVNLGGTATFSGITIGPFTPYLSQGRRIYASMDAITGTFLNVQVVNPDVSDTTVINQLKSVIDNDGSLYVAGVFGNPVTTLTFGTHIVNRSGIGNGNSYIAKLNIYGIWEWAISPVSNANGNNDTYSIILDDNGSNLYVAGNFGGDPSGTLTIGATVLTTSTNLMSRLWIAKINPSTGAWIWATGTTGTSQIAIPNTMILDNSGNITIGGSYLSGTVITPAFTLNSSINRNIMILKVDSLGVWQAGISSTSIGTLIADVTDLLINNNNNYIVVGGYRGNITLGTNSLSAVGSTLFIAKLNTALTTWEGVIDNGGTTINHISSPLGAKYNSSIGSINIVGVITDIPGLTFGKTTLDITNATAAFRNLYNTRVLVDTLSSRLISLDLQNPALPKVLSTVNLAGSPTVSSLIAKGSYVYIFTYMANEQAVLSYNISNPSSPIFVDKLVLNTIVSGTYNYFHPHIQDNYLFAIGIHPVGVNPTGPVSINISNPASMTIGSSLYTNDVDYGVFLGKYGYVISTSDNILRLVDISNPAALVYIATTYTLTSPISLSTVGKYLYINESPSSTLNIYETNSVFNQQMQVGSLKTNDLSVDGLTQISKSLNVSGGMQINKGFNIQGDSSISSDITIDGQLKISGKLKKKIRTITASYTLADDYAININNTGPIIINLPAISSISGSREYILIKLSGQGNNVILTAAVNNNILNNTTLANTYTWSAITNSLLRIISNGKIWIIR